MKAESRFDGKWVLRTDTELPPAEVALKYKDLLLVDDLDELQELTMTVDEKTFVVRTATRGDAGKAIQAAGVALGPSTRHP